MQEIASEPQRFMVASWRLYRGFLNTAASRLDRQLGLSVREVFVLKRISSGLRHPGQLGEALDLPSHTTSRVLDPLVKAGLIKRVLDEGDARRVLLSLTPEGEERLSAAATEWEDEAARLLERLPAERRAAFLADLETIAGPRDARGKGERP
ncbi:MAG TPA: MarR family winged helix-turn-helix transcriptional regulator [Deinococcales bacterium]|nr:MarR family winged helix-turn-helix transcriptional regulator [Deinococcales bacterium]